jgi:DNA-binding MarR family transcriptional regulator
MRFKEIEWWGERYIDRVEARFHRRILWRVLEEGEKLIVRLKCLLSAAEERVYPVGLRPV